jgi:hypothetical protein
MLPWFGGPRITFTVPRPLYGTAFKPPLGSAVLYKGQREHQPFKFVALHAMENYRGAKYSFMHF